MTTKPSTVTVAAYPAIACAACGAEHDVETDHGKGECTSIAEVEECTTDGGGDYVCPCGALLTEADLVAAYDAAVLYHLETEDYG